MLSMVAQIQMLLNNPLFIVFSAESGFALWSEHYIELHAFCIRSNSILTNNIEQHTYENN